MRPLSYDLRFHTDLLFLAVGTIFLFVSFFVGHKKKLKRWQAAILLAAYIGYTSFLIYTDA